MRWLQKNKRGLSQGQRGLTLIEALVAVAILGAIGVTFISAVNAGYGSLRVLDEKTQAEALIRSQLDDIRASTYADNYPVTVDIPYQYSVIIDVEALDTETCVADVNCNTLQKITVTVSRPIDGGYRPVLDVSTYKVKE